MKLPAHKVEVITPDPRRCCRGVTCLGDHPQTVIYRQHQGWIAIARSGCGRAISTTMELGGNAPFIVCGDADLDAAVDGAMIAKMRNGGAACTAANRFYVHSDVHDRFVDMLTSKMSALVMGDGLDPTSTVGVMVNRSQQQRVADLVNTAIAEGAEVLCGGQIATDGSCGYQPTVLTGVRHGHTITGEEIFGPVAAVIAVDDIEDSIPLFNDTPYGLVSYLYSGDAGRAMRIASRLESGMIGINRGLVSDPSAPFGGFKESGIGREGAHEGLLAFCETKYFAVDW